MSFYCYLRNICVPSSVGCHLLNSKGVISDMKELITVKGV